MNRKALLAITIVFLAGLVAWWSLREKSRKADPAAETAANKTDVAPKRMEGKAPGPGGNQGEIRVLADDDPDGTLLLEGQVVRDSNGDKVGVADALVMIDTQPPRTTRTEDDGSFAFDKLVGRSYDLVASAPDGVAGPVTARLVEGHEPVILVLGQGGKVKVEVVDSAGNAPIAGARVELRGIVPQEQNADGAGIAVFEPVAMGFYDVVAQAPGYAMQHGNVVLSRAGAAAETRLALRRGAAVSGTVVDEGGKPVAKARVSYEGASEWSLRSDPRLDAAITDQDGRFRFDALPAGSFRFTARNDELAPGSSELIQLDGVAEHSGIEIKLEAGASVRGDVVDKAGAPVPAARVRVAVLTRSFVGDRNVRQTYADAQGRFEIKGLARKPLTVVAMHEGAASDAIEVDASEPPHQVELTVPLDVDGVIAGIVVDGRGEPIEGAQVSVFPDFRAGRGPRGRGGFWMRGMSEVLTDAGGRFEVGGLEDDEVYRVRAVPSSSQGRGRAWLTEGVQAKVGDKDVRVLLPADGGIKGKVAFVDGEAPGLFTVSVGWRDGSPFSTEDGSFELQDLPPQTFTITVRGPDFDAKQVANVVVAEGKTVDLGTITVTKGRSIAGTVVDSSGRAVVGATVRAGRMLMGDGSSTTSEIRNPMTRNIKETQTDESGQFRISGIGASALSVVAEHQAVGRSIAMQLPATSESSTGLQLALQPGGVLEGKVTQGGKPADAIIVTAASTTNASVSFNVATGADGSYRFDRLTPDQYKVSAMTGRNPMAGMMYFAKTVAVSAGETAKLDLEIDGGGIELEVSLTASNGKTLGFAWVMMSQGVIAGATGRQLFEAVGGQSGQWGQSMSIMGQPVTLRNLSAGRYSVCAIPYPTEVEGMGGTLDYMEREGDNLKAQCKTAQLVDGQPQQKMQLAVEVPDFVPAPGGS